MPRLTLISSPSKLCAYSLQNESCTPLLQTSVSANRVPDDGFPLTFRPQKIDSGDSGVTLSDQGMHMSAKDRNVQLWRLNSRFLPLHSTTRLRAAGPSAFPLSDATPALSFNVLINTATGGDSNADTNLFFPSPRITQRPR